MFSFSFVKAVVKKKNPFWHSICLKILNCVVYLWPENSIINSFRELTVQIHVLNLWVIVRETGLNELNEMSVLKNHSGPSVLIQLDPAVLKRQFNTASYPAENTALI